METILNQNKPTKQIIKDLFFEWRKLNKAFINSKNESDKKELLLKMQKNSELSNELQLSTYDYRTIKDAMSYLCIDKPKNAMDNDEKLRVLNLIIEDEAQSFAAQQRKGHGCECFCTYCMM